jgi:hypothetical protein
MALQRNEAEAVRLFSKASKLGNLDAIGNLAVLHQRKCHCERSWKGRSQYIKLTEDDVADLKKLAAVLKEFEGFRAPRRMTS